MNTNITDSNKFDSSKSNNNTSISLSLLDTTFGNRDVKAGSSSVTKVLTHVEQPSEAKTIGIRNLHDGSRRDYDDEGDGPQPLKPIGVTTKPTGNTHIKERDYDDDGPQPLKPMGVTTQPTGNTHIKERDYDDDGPQPLKPMGATTKSTGNTHIKERNYDDDGSQPLKPMGVTTQPTGYAHIKERDYNDDGPQPLKPMGVTTQPTGNAPLINQPEQPQKAQSKSSVQDLGSGSGNKKAKSDEKTQLLEEPLKPLGPQEACCSSCVIL